MKVWALYSSDVDMYSAHELVDLFADEATALTVRDCLIGKPKDRGTDRLTWHDDEEYPDLYVQSIEVRP